MTDEVRSESARKAAEGALVRVAVAYGETPSFILLGGLVPGLLCASSTMRHAGTTDVDVQVNLEISASQKNGKRLENALIAADFKPTQTRVWRWEAPRSDVDGRRGSVIKFELLADLDDQQAGAEVIFDDCERLGAANLRGTGAVTDDFRTLEFTSASKAGTPVTASIHVTGLAGFLLAKVAAAEARRAEKDYYDIAFVLLHNGNSDPEEAADRILDVFGKPKGARATQITELRANFSGPGSQGVESYVTQILVDHPETDPSVAAADAQLAVEAFCDRLLEAPDEEPIEVVSARLAEGIGSMAVAQLAGAQIVDVDRWALDGYEPTAAETRRLRLGDRILALISTKVGPNAARTWFGAPNPGLGQDTPVLAIREHRKVEVLVAATAVVQDGDRQPESAPHRRAPR